MQYSSIAELDMIVNILENKKAVNITPSGSSQEPGASEDNGKFSIKFVE